jgi:glycosyltransferase involved in cell wall biosynthesis
LMMVGSLGWHHKQIVRKFLPWLERGDAFLLEDVLAEELRVLYTHAGATVCPSFGEGFDFSGVEAMKCGSPVIASDIPVHREVYADAAEFFNPYSVDSLAHAIKITIDPMRSGRREELVAQGKAVVERYSADSILPKWRSFLQLQGSVTSSPAAPAPAISWT